MVGTPYRPPAHRDRENVMTQYLLAVHHAEGEAYPSDEEMQQAFADTDAFNQELMRDGSWVFGGGLTEPSDATVVDATKGGEPLVTDGPFAETKEQLGGFWVVEAADLDAALDLARRGSAACRQPVEVRPFQSE
jgi:hypothetical protein